MLNCQKPTDSKGSIKQLENYLQLSDLRVPGQLAIQGHIPLDQETNRIAEPASLFGRIITYLSRQHETLQEERGRFVYNLKEV